MWPVDILLYLQNFYLFWNAYSQTNRTGWPPRWVAGRHNHWIKRAYCTARNSYNRQNLLSDHHSTATSTYLPSFPTTLPLALWQNVDLFVSTFDSRLTFYVAKGENWLEGAFNGPTVDCIICICFERSFRHGRFISCYGRRCKVRWESYTNWIWIEHKTPQP